MTTTEDYLKQARVRDQRKRLASVTDPDRNPGFAPAANALRGMLAPRRKVAWNEAVRLMDEASAGNLSLKVVDTLIRDLITAGFIVRTGDYSRGYNRKLKTWIVKDTRMLTLGDWQA